MNKVKKAILKRILFVFMLIVLVFLGLAEKAQAVYMYSNNHLYKDSWDMATQHACLTLMVYMEAKGESREGREAVSMVILNRVASPKYPNSVCAVIAQNRQFEPMSRRDIRDAIQQIQEGHLFAGLELVEKLDPISFRQAYAKIEYITHAMMHAQIHESASDRWIKATHFYSPRSLKRRSLPSPAWTTKLLHVATIGNHVFLTY